MNISDNVLKGRLKNVFFLRGKAYGGKTTMAKRLTKRMPVFLFLCQAAGKKNGRQSVRFSYHLLCLRNHNHYLTIFLGNKHCYHGRALGVIQSG